MPAVPGAAAPPTAGSATGVKLGVGLGLGIASRCILTYPSVDTLTTIELRKNVIKSHEDIVQLLDKKSEKWAPYDSKRHIIKNYDGFMYMLKTTNKTNYKIIEDRKDAIKYAIDKSQKDDIVLITGKGRDNYMAIEDRKEPYNDYDEIKKNI